MDHFRQLTLQAPKTDDKIVVCIIFKNCVVQTKTYLEF